MAGKEGKDEKDSREEIEKVFRLFDLESKGHISVMPDSPRTALSTFPCSI